MIGGDTIVDARFELAHFLRARREEIQPETVGITPRGRRRVKGLRRSEVASLAGVSDTWYTWIEQGRAIRVRGEHLDALARALCLDEDSYRYARRLAGLAIPEPANPDGPTPQLVTFVDDVLPDPCCVFNPAYDLVAWNSSFSVVFGDPVALPPAQRNGLWYLFMTAYRECSRNWPAECRNAVARLRDEAARQRTDPRFGEVVELLESRSPEFADLWRSRRVAHTRDATSVLDHPLLGVLQLDLLQFRPVNQSNLLLVIHRPVDSSTRQRLASLRAPVS
jgi:transcriptional regulator with XRE-family HTH domain